MLVVAIFELGIPGHGRVQLQWVCASASLVSLIEIAQGFSSREIAQTSVCRLMKSSLVRFVPSAQIRSNLERSQLLRR